MLAVSLIWFLVVRCSVGFLKSVLAGPEKRTCTLGRARSQPRSSRSSPAEAGAQSPAPAPCLPPFYCQADGKNRRKSPCETPDEFQAPCRQRSLAPSSERSSLACGVPRPLPTCLQPGVPTYVVPHATRPFRPGECTCTHSPEDSRSRAGSSAHRTQMVSACRSRENRAPVRAPESVPTTAGKLLKGTHSCPLRCIACAARRFRAR